MQQTSTKFINRVQIKLENLIHIFYSYCAKNKQYTVKKTFLYHNSLLHHSKWNELLRTKHKLT